MSVLDSEELVKPLLDKREMYGVAKGYEKAISFIKEKAIKLFIDGKDDMATFLRELVLEMSKDNEKLYNEWRSINQESAWDIIDNILKKSNRNKDNGESNENK